MKLISFVAVLPFVDCIAVVVAVVVDHPFDYSCSSGSCSSGSCSFGSYSSGSCHLQEYSCCSFLSDSFHLHHYSSGFHTSYLAFEDFLPSYSYCCPAFLDSASDS